MLDLSLDSLQVFQDIPNLYYQHNFPQTLSTIIYISKKYIFKLFYCSHLASGSGDTTVRFWDVDTELPKKTSKGGHKNWVLIV